MNNWHIAGTGLGMALLPLLASCRQENTGRPNIIVILADDMGYSDIGCYGGEIDTPNIDSLASKGLRWQQFYNCARSCPSRAALMTGLYPHQAGMGWMTTADMQRPQYQGYLNNSCVTLAEVLGSAGYGTYMVGKWHLSSDRQNSGDVAERWPCRRGFGKFYGIPGGTSNYFSTEIIEGDTRKRTGEDFYITDAFGDTASTYISRHDFGKAPMFLYLAFNAPHWPLHALPEDIMKYRDTYMAGWDRLREERFRRQVESGLLPEWTEPGPRDAGIPAWEDLTEAQKEEFAMRMAIYAGQVDAMDRNIGKVISAIREAGQEDNTIIMFMSDNGGCSEYISSGRSKDIDGEADTWESYRKNWANLSNTPFREYKHYTHEGGIVTPLIVKWPDGIDESLQGNIVREYGHFTDIMATCVEVSGAVYPETRDGNEIIPMEGTSLVPAFSGEKTSRGKLFWEHEGNIAVRDGRWKIVLKTGEGHVFDTGKTELYDLEADPAEMHDLSDRMPEKVREMLGDWDRWAVRTDVYPIDTRLFTERKAAYRRVINGEFQDNFGDWARKSSPGSGVSFSIETGAPVSGTKSAAVKIEDTGSVDKDASLEWAFPTDGPVLASCGFKYRASCANTLEFRIENGSGPAKEVFSETVILGKGAGQASFPDIRIPGKGEWRLVFHFGRSLPGEIVIDDVKLEFK